MVNKYAEYIRMRIALKYGNEAWRTLGQCKPEVEAMKEKFPELEVVRGHVTAWFSSVGPMRRAHWWLTDPEGNIVDPTAGQFELGVGDYEPWTEGDPIRLGRCMNCGEEIWGTPEENKDSCCCSERCARVLEAEFR